MCRSAVTCSGTVTHTRARTSCSSGILLPAQAEGLVRRRQPRYANAIDMTQRLDCGELTFLRMSVGNTIFEYTSSCHPTTLRVQPDMGGCWRFGVSYGKPKACVV